MKRTRNRKNLIKMLFTLYHKAEMVFPNKISSCTFNICLTQPVPDCLKKQGNQNQMLALIVLSLPVIFILSIGCMSKQNIYNLNVFSLLN